MTDDIEHELLEQLADPIVAAGMRLATPEETQAIVDQAVAHVREQEALIAATPLARTIEGKPELPPEANTFHTTMHYLGDQIAAMVAEVHDPSVAYGPNRDGYGKCVEVMWRAAYLAMETVARELGVTGFQHSIACGEAYRHLARIDGPFMVLRIEDALYPQKNLHARLQEALDDSRKWLAEKAREYLVGDLSHVHPDVVAHWHILASAGGDCPNCKNTGAVHVGGCTCGAGRDLYGHEPGCGLEPCPCGREYNP